MRILFFLTCLCVAVASQPKAEYYIEKFVEFCRRINNDVCTEEMIKTGMIYFERQVEELKRKIDDKRRILRKAERDRRIQHIREQQLRQKLREHFLDRHI